MLISFITEGGIRSRIPWLKHATTFFACGKLLFWIEKGGKGFPLPPLQS
jgi:hypothetical protein